LIIKPVTELSIYGSYSVSFLPSSGDQFSSLAIPTQELKPEKFENFEAGTKWDIGRKLSFTSAVFRLDRTNTRANDPDRPGYFVLTGSQRTNGAEFGFNANVIRTWSLSGGYAYQDAVITRATASAPVGNDVAQVPHHNFSLWNKYQFNSRFSAGFGLIRRTDMFAAIDNTVVLPGYTRADAAVYYVFNENWKLQANIENVFNTKYFVNADNNTNISPGAPIGVRAGLVARF
jgi:catecholate siderophore receptor